MLNRFKSALVSALGNQDESMDTDQPREKPPKFAYRRPTFLDLDSDALAVYSDHKMRPILNTNFNALPYNAGYAECINAGKSRYNEDQAVCLQGVLLCNVRADRKENIPYTYYGLFDGHGGTGAALTAASQFHHLLQDKLVDAQDELLGVCTSIEDDDEAENDGVRWNVSVQEELVIGALEAAFHEMDQVLAADRERYAPAGGCTALVMLILLDKIYVANAGDSRAVLYDGVKTVTMSNDFSPYYDRKRIQTVGQEHPNYLNNQFSFLEYKQQVRQEDLGRRIMYRTPSMDGWAFKTATADDLKHGIVQGLGRRSRIMGVLGVARGFGDYDLTGHHKVAIKPFISSNPEIICYNLEQVREGSFMLMATDGLWDVLGNKEAVKGVIDMGDTFQEDRKYLCAATCLVAAARGSNNTKNYWYTKKGQPGSMDDISLFVVPLHPIKEALDKIINLLCS